MLQCVPAGTSARAARDALAAAGGDVDDAVELLVRGARDGGGAAAAAAASARAPAKLECDRCGGEHASDACPHYSRPRDDHPAARPPPSGAGGAATTRAAEPAGAPPGPRSVRSGACPCGSGKKYKKCCRAADLRRQRAPPTAAPPADTEQADAPTSQLAALAI